MNYLKSFFCFMQPGEYRKEVYLRIYQQMHRIYHGLMALILAYECVMLAVMASRPGGLFLHGRRTAYVCCYLVLIVSTALFLLLHRRMWKTGTLSMRRYYRLLHAYVVVLTAWAIAISLNDQLGGNGLTVYTYVLLGTALFAMLPPWKSVLLYGLSFLALNLLLPFFPWPSGLDQTFNNLTNSLFVSLFAIFLSIYFYKSQIALKTDEMIIEQQYQEIAEKNQALHEEIMIDALTKLYNRRYLDLVVEKRFRAQQRRKQALACLMLDLDHFKDYNDQYGHPAGDVLLCRLSSLFRDLPAKEQADVIRYGGEEFVVFLYGQDAREAGRLAQFLVDSVRGLQIPAAAGSPYVTISAGVCLLDPIPPEEDSVHILISCADTALYQAKNQGRNRVSFYREE